MLVKKIKYSDLDGNPREEEFYFHFGQAELIKLAQSEGGALDKKISRIIASNDGEQILREFERIVELSYGRRSEDGRTFEKSPELWRAFRQSPAYDVFFMELVTNAEAAADFVNKVMPPELIAQVHAAVPGSEVTIQDVAQIEGVPAYMRERREPTKHELAGMTKAQLVEAMQFKQALKASLEEKVVLLEGLAYDPTDPSTAWLRERREATLDEVMRMTPQQLDFYQKYLPQL